MKYILVGYRVPEMLVKNWKLLTLIIHAKGELLYTKKTKTKKNKKKTTYKRLVVDNQKSICSFLYKIAHNIYTH